MIWTDVVLNGCNMAAFIAQCTPEKTRLIRSISIYVVPEHLDEHAQYAEAERARASGEQTILNRSDVVSRLEGLKDKLLSTNLTNLAQALKRMMRLETFSFTIKAAMQDDISNCSSVRRWSEDLQVLLKALPVTCVNLKLNIAKHRLSYLHSSYRAL